MHGLNFLAAVAVAGVLVVSVGCSRNDAERAREAGRNAVHTAQNAAHKVENLAGQAANALDHHVGHGNAPTNQANHETENHGSAFQGNHAENKAENKTENHADKDFGY